MRVASDVLRKAWIWGVLVGAVLVTRYVLDTLTPVQYIPGVVHPRSAIMSYALIAVFVLSSGRQVWRLGELRTGVLVAFATAVLGGALAVAGTALCLATWHDPETLRAAQGSGGLDEALWGVPLLLVPIGLVTGTMGAIAGRLAGAIAHGVSTGTR